MNDTTSNPSPENDTNSVEPVSIRYRLAVDDALEMQTLQAKCSNCKTTTSNQWLKANVKSSDPIEDDEQALELLKKSKRIILCQNCGTIRVTN